MVDLALTFEYDADLTQTFIRGNVNWHQAYDMNPFTRSENQPTTFIFENLAP